jgi:hypothetical protein
MIDFANLKMDGLLFRIVVSILENSHTFSLTDRYGSLSFRRILSGFDWTVEIFYILKDA